MIVGFFFSEKEYLLYVESGTIYHLIAEIGGFKHFYFAEIGGLAYFYFAEIGGRLLMLR